MKKTLLITGGAGFIGSHVVKHCLALGHEVVSTRLRLSREMWFAQTKEKGRAA